MCARVTAHMLLLHTQTYKNTTTVAAFVIAHPPGCCCCALLNYNSWHDFTPAVLAVGFLRTQTVNRYVRHTAMHYGIDAEPERLCRAGSS